MWRLFLPVIFFFCIYKFVVVQSTHLHHNDGRRHLPARREVEVEDLVVDDLLGESLGHHLGQCLLLGLRLPCQLGGAVTEARDVVLCTRVEVKWPYQKTYTSHWVQVAPWHLIDGHCLTDMIVLWMDAIVNGATKPDQRANSHPNYLKA